VVHTFHFGNYPHLDKGNARLERMFGRFADARVAVGHAQAAAIRQTYGWSEACITTIWNGIPRRPIRIDEARLGPIRARGRVVVGMVGTLTEQKGHRDLFEAIVRLRSRGVFAHYVIVGGGRLRGELERACDELGLRDDVTFLGWVHDAAETILPGLEVFVQPSRWEAMSMVLLEAASLRLPIVCTNVGEASRVLENGIEALIVEPKDVTAIADSLERLIRDGQLRRDLGAAAAAKVETTCTADFMVSRYEALYRLQLNGDRRPLPAESLGV
jgi:glycosyltransferase involved in cell wall biosynthesis